MNFIKKGRETTENTYDRTVIVSAAKFIDEHDNPHLKKFHGSICNLMNPKKPEAFGRYNKTFFLQASQDVQLPSENGFSFSQVDAAVLKYPMEHKRRYLFSSEQVQAWLAPILQHPDFQGLELDTLLIPISEELEGLYAILQEAFVGDEASKNFLVSYQNAFESLQKLHKLNLHLQEAYGIYLDYIGWNCFFDTAAYVARAYLPEILTIAGIVRSMDNLRGRIFALLQQDDLYVPKNPFWCRTKPLREVDFHMENILYKQTEDGQLITKMHDLIPFMTEMPGKVSADPENFHERLRHVRNVISYATFQYQEYILYPLMEKEYHYRMEGRMDEFEKDMWKDRRKVAFHVTKLLLMMGTEVFRPLTVLSDEKENLTD